MSAGVLSYNRLVITGRPAWKRASDDSLLAKFSGSPSLGVHRQVMALFHSLAASRIEGLRNLHPAYCSLLVVYDPLRWSPEDLIGQLEQADRSAALMPPEARRIDVPVCCDVPFAPDLEPIAAAAGLTTDAAVDRLMAAEYRVAFLGFAPGFPYLLGLPPELAAPRLERPRIRVPGRQSWASPAPRPASIRRRPRAAGG